MRKETLQEILCSIGGLENSYLDNPDQEPISLQSAIDYVYDEVMSNANSNRFGVTTAIRFDGKKKIIEKIREELLKSDDIIFKDVK